MENMQDYLQADWNFDFYHPAMIKLCQSLTEGCSSDSEKAVRLFYYVRDNCHYNMYATTGKREAYQSSAILTSGQGWCLQKAILLTSLARAAGIPGRLILVSIRNHKSPPEAVEMMGTNLFFPHAYNYLYLNGKWVKAAATFDREICERIKVPAVEFDGEHDAILSPQDLNGQPYIEYVDEYGCFATVPWKLILENARQVYGDLSDKWFKND
jgi:transglutaminase-like putative cysteine protease